MIKFVSGNILDHGKDQPGVMLINPVNTQGIMGKGLALAFKEKYPENFSRYQHDCSMGLVRIGFMNYYFEPDFPFLLNAKCIVNFPTKEEWRNPSKIEWIIEGLHSLHNLICFTDAKQVAIPALGCGNGKLDWKEVKYNILNILNTVHTADIYIYEP